MDADKVASIRAQAEALAGQSLGENGDLKVVACAAIARSLCCREDIPQDMEAVVARMAVLMLRHEGGAGGVKSITRGDTSISYETAMGEAFGEILTQLSPFRRLGRLK